MSGGQSYSKGDHVMIVEGEGSGQNGKVTSVQEGQFGKQWLEVESDEVKKTPFGMSAVFTVRKRASDVRPVE